MSTPTDNARGWILGLLFGALLGVGAIVLFAWHFGHHPGVSGLLITAVALALSGAAVLGGVLLGFLFGLSPLKKDDKNRAALWEISDWLTKIIVGATLVQLGHVPDVVARLGSAVRPALGDDPASGVFGVAIMAYFLVDGFFMGFLWSHLFMVDKISTSVSTSV